MRTRIRPSSMLLIVILFAGVALAADAPGPAPPAAAPRAAREEGPAMPDTPAGRHAAGFLAAYHANDRAARERFYAGAVSAEALARRPLAQRLETLERVHADLGRLTVRAIRALGEATLAVICDSERGGRVELTFECEPDPPHHFVGVRIEALDGGEAAGAPAGPPLTEAAFRDSVARLLDAEAAAGRHSGAVLIARGDRVLVHAAHGLAERRFGAPNRVDTRFNLGSINKLFTRLAIGRLAEAGRLSLDDPLSKHLPDHPRAVADRITIGQLVEHRSGLGDVFNERWARADRSAIRRLADYLPLFVDRPLEFEPGARERYSNAGYVVLGLVIERVTGEDYYEHIRRTVFEPAGMAASGWFPSDSVVGNVAMGYTRLGPDDREGAVEREHVHTRPGRGSSAGGGHSTVDDLWRFVQALRAGTLCSPSVRAWLVGGAPLGAVTPGADDPIELGVAGGAPGVSALIELDGRSGVSLIALANQDPGSLGRIARRVQALARRLERS